MPQEVNSEDLELHVRRFVLSVAEMIKGELQKAGHELSADIQSQMKFTEPAAGEFRVGEKLGVESGDLSRATVPGKKGNIFSISGSLIDGFEIEYGIDGDVIVYAWIQEEGGFVKHKGKMPYYLFHLARETGHDMYRIIGASALKHGGITIKARPYFAPGVDQFRTETWPKKLEYIAEEIPRIWEETR